MILTIKVLDTVVLQKDLPDHALKRGDIGAVVEVYAPDGVEVEFVTGAGKTQALVTLKKTDLRPVGGSEIIAVRSLEPA